MVFRIVLLRSGLVATLAVFGALGASAATLTLGTAFNPFWVSSSPSLGGLVHAWEAGGDAGGVLDGVTLRGTYCVGLLDTVYLGQTYVGTQVTRNGTVYGTPVPNAGKISWLLTHYAPFASTPESQMALQAAIWRTEYGSNFQLDGADNAIAGNSPSLISAYQSILASAVGQSAPVAAVLWMSPDDATVRSPHYQGLVGLDADSQRLGTAPEPRSLALAALGLIGLPVWRRRCARANG